MAVPRKIEYESPSIQIKDTEWNAFGRPLHNTRPVTWPFPGRGVGKSAGTVGGIPAGVTPGGIGVFVGMTEVVVGMTEVVVGMAVVGGGMTVAVSRSNVVAGTTPVENT